MKTYVFSENSELLFELITQARSYGNVCAIVKGNAELVSEASQYGADIIWLGDDEVLLDSYIPTIAEIIQNAKPELFMVGATIMGRFVAASCAAKLSSMAVQNIKSLDVDIGSAKLSQMIYAGNAVRSLDCGHTTAIALIKSGAFQAEKASQIGNISAYSAKLQSSGIKRREVKPLPPKNDGVLTAKKVIGVGGGLDGKGRLDDVRELANALEAELGYTRPVVEADPPIVENERYIGVTGIQIKPELYIACGVSGQAQHMVGVNEAKLIACINKDANARIFKNCDYGIVGDMFELIPEIVKAIKK